MLHHNLPTMEAHKQAVAAISSIVRKFFARREPYRIFHGSTNSTRPRTAATGHAQTVDICTLNHVLDVDRARQVALVEPNVPMDQLVAATLQHGLIPPVVMEFPGITAGGGYAGTAGESSSFRHGFFDHTINKVEMVLASGEVVEASPSLSDPRRDLFRGAAGALGTLGITTLMELQLVPAKRYVRTTYHRCGSVRETIDRIQEMADPSSTHDYVDGILFSKDHGVVVTGTRTDEAPADNSRAQTFSHAGDPWFYLHVKQQTKSPSRKDVTEHIPLAEYLFRYDRGGFWVGKSAFSYWPFPFNRLTRWFLDDFLHTRMLYKALHASGHSATYMVQDLALPYATAEAFVDYAADAFGIWPLWLCPLPVPATPTFHPHAILDARLLSTGAAAPAVAPVSMLNIGLWGRPASAPSAAGCVALNRELEHRLSHDFGGMKWFYAHAYYAEDEFWRVYNRSAYDGLRAKYHATSLPSVYDKLRTKTSTGVDASWRTRWPWAGVYGLRQAIQSRAYLPRTPPWRE